MPRKEALLHSCRVRKDFCTKINYIEITGYGSLMVNNSKAGCWERVYNRDKKNPVRRLCNHTGKIAINGCTTCQ